MYVAFYIHAFLLNVRRIIQTYNCLKSSKGRLSFYIFLYFFLLQRIILSQQTAWHLILRQEGAHRWVCLLGSRQRPWRSGETPLGWRGPPSLFPGSRQAAAHILPHIGTGWLAACEPDATWGWLLAYSLFCRGHRGSCSGGKPYVAVSRRITVEYYIILEVFPAGFTVQANIKCWEIWQS